MLEAEAQRGVTVLRCTIDFQPSHFASAKAWHLHDEKPRPLGRQGMNNAEVLTQRWTQTDICSFTADAQSKGMLFLRMKAEGKSHHGPEQNER